MIKIPVAELRMFLAKASEIKGNNILPILNYVKLDCVGESVTITKTNMLSFIVYQVQGAKFSKNFSLLLEETMLSTAAKESTAKEMEISFVEKKHATAPSGVVRIVSFRDTEGTDLKCQAEDEKTFPQIPEGEKKEAIKFNQDIIDSIFLGSKCCNGAKEIKLWQDFVHLKSLGKKKSYICGMNGMIMYYKVYNIALPDISLEPHICSILQNYSELNYYSGGNYNFFDAGKTLLGFIKSEVTIPDFPSVVEKMDGSKYYSIDRKQVISFCKTAISINPLSIVGACNLANNDDKSVVFDYENNETERRAKRVVEVKKNKKFVLDKFIFNPKDMLTILESLPHEKVNLVGPTNNNYYVLVDDDKDYVGALREIKFTNEAKTQADANKK